jgi:hypothetical protein
VEEVEGPENQDWPEEQVGGLTLRLAKLNAKGVECRSEATFIKSIVSKLDTLGEGKMNKPMPKFPRNVKAHTLPKQTCFFQRGHLSGSLGSFGFGAGCSTILPLLLS